MAPRGPARRLVTGARTESEKNVREGRRDGWRKEERKWTPDSLSPFLIKPVTLPSTKAYF